MTTTMSNLAKDLVEDIVSRVPWKYMRAVRLTCKNWNVLFESRSFTKMHIDKEEVASRELGETRMVVMMNYNVYLMGTAVSENPSIQFLGKLTCLDDSKQVKISQIFHCKGLLLCILKEDDTKIVVWNPYLGQTRWIKTRTHYPKTARKGRHVNNYALGYENNSPKILRFLDDFTCNHKKHTLRYEVYDFDTDLWTTLDVAPNWRIVYHHRGLSLKGNTYWGVVELEKYDTIDHIICFDFTRERFGSLLPLPFKAIGSRFSSLSSVREEKIVALFQPREFKVEIWITTKIDANDVSWNNFFTLSNNITLVHTNFLIDEEKKLAVVINKDIKVWHNNINFIGEVGCLRKLKLGEDINCWPRLCSYVPSIVLIKQRKRGKRTKQSD